MQIMPATAKDLNVGDINQVEANINGGIKYMRWMIDNYYGKEPMSNLDKAPARVRGLQLWRRPRRRLAQGSRQARTGPERLVP